MHEQLSVLHFFVMLLYSIGTVYSRTGRIDKTLKGMGKTESSSVVTAFVIVVYYIKIAIINSR